MAVHLRYCPACREEYQPHMVRCVECGAALKDLLEDGEPVYDTPSGGEPLLPPGDYLPIAGDLSSAVASRAVRALTKAGIPAKVGAQGYAMFLSVRAQDAEAARPILASVGALPDQQPDAAEGGPCPACGAELAPGATQCPDCGLRFRFDDEDGEAAG